jgi:transcriptional regulator with XRE-family HTH domain
VTTVDLIPQPHFGERLRRLRQQRGLKQADLADSGLSASYISRIESGNRAVTAQLAQVLAERLGVDISVFQSNREVSLTRLLADAQASLAVANYAAAAEAFESALDQVAGARLPTLWLIRHGLATTLSNLGRIADWRHHQQELVRLATEAASPDLLTQAYTGLSNCLRLAGEVGAAYAAACSARAHSREPDVSPGHEIHAMMALVAAETETGRAADAAHRSDEMLALLTDETPEPLRAQARWAAAASYVARGRHDDGIALLKRAIHDLDSGEDLVTWARLRLSLVSLIHRSGQRANEEARGWFVEGARVLRLIAIPIYLVQTDVIEARIAFDQEQYAEAIRLSEAALTDGNLLSFRDRVRTQMLLATATARVGDREGPIRDLEVIAQNLDEVGARDLSAEAWRILAELALSNRTDGKGTA